jgi:hypothetical protein
LIGPVEVAAEGGGSGGGLWRPSSHGPTGFRGGEAAGMAAGAEGRGWLSGSTDHALSGNRSAYCREISRSVSSFARLDSTMQCTCACGCRDHSRPRAANAGISGKDKASMVCAVGRYFSHTRNMRLLSNQHTSSSRKSIVARILLAHLRTELDPNGFVVFGYTPGLGDQSSRSSELALGSDCICRLKADEFRVGRTDREIAPVMEWKSLSTIWLSTTIG